MRLVDLIITCENFVKKVLAQLVMASDTGRWLIRGLAVHASAGPCVDRRRVGDKEAEK